MIKKTMLPLLCFAIILSSAFPVNAATKPKKDKTASVIISAAGDCTLGVDSRYNSKFNNYYKSHDDAYFLKKVNGIFQKDDITIVNFEGTLTTSQNRANKKFTFKGPSNYANILKKGSVEVVNIANNHTFDFGRNGYDDTKNTLSSKDIAYCGNGNIAYQKVNGIKVAFLGFNALSNTTKNDIKRDIEKAKKKKAQIIIVSFHWGIERQYYPTEGQKSLGRYAIDQGAALVLGHHPHVLQGIEKYKGQYIVYSLGNFCFGGNSNPSDKDTMIFRQKFYVKDGKLTKKTRARIIPCSLSSSSSHNDFQPRRLSGTSKKNLLKKIEKLSSGKKVKIDSNGVLE